MQHQTKRRLVIGAQGITLGALVIGAVGFIGADKTVALTVDGKTQDVQTFGGDVDAVLRAAHVSVDAQDEVSPSLDSRVSDGAVVRVRLARDVSLSVDGTERTVTTTASTVGELADQLGLEDGSQLSEAKDMQLASATELSVRTPKTVRLNVAGKQRSVTTTALDVDALLREEGVRPDKDDRVSPARNTVVTDGLAVEFTSVRKKTETVRDTLEFNTTEVKDPTLAKGKTKTKIEGKDGQRVRTYAVTLENGEQVSRKKTGDEVASKPVTKIVLVGTKEDEPKEGTDSSSKTSGGTKAAGPGSGVWYQLAKCESGGNWGINTGNGYYGGLQFTASTWRAQGGTAYAPLPSQATPAQQIVIASKLQKKAGWGQWPACTSKLGLR